MPAILLSFVLVLLMTVFPADVPPIQPEEPRPPIYLSADTANTAAQPTLSPDVENAETRLVERTVAHLQAMGLNVTPSGRSAFLVAPASSTGGSLVPIGAPGADGTLPTNIVRLSIGFNGSSFAPAAGSETDFGGGDTAWRLAYQVERNVVGGLRDVLDYDDYDRGEVEETQPAAGQGTGADGPWVSAYPLFATNPSESSLLQQPGSQDVISAALANAIWSYLDPTVRTSTRLAARGWHQAPSWHPVAPRVISKTDDPTKLALTYDAGGSAEPTPAILKALRDAGVHATIFLTGDYVAKNPDLVVQMARDGHEFGNHSSTHPDMTTVSSETMISELQGVETKVLALTGKSTRPWFRPPFGAYNDRTVQVAADLGYDSIMWTEDSADWRNDIDAATVEARILRYAKPGAIMIEHLGSPQSAQVLPEVLRVLKERGITFGTLSEVLNTP